MNKYALIMTTKFPDAEYAVAEDGTFLAWNEPGEPPTVAEMDAWWPEVQTERGWSDVRRKRDRLLTSSDWTQVVDAPLTAGEKQAWAVYRQALRDIPQDFDSPDDVVWPEAP